MFAALKPGGFLVIADHSALPGQGTSVSHTLHRIEESTLRQEIEAAGFKFVAEGNFWRNAADTHDFPSYKPTCRWTILCSSSRSRCELRRSGASRVLAREPGRSGMTLALLQLVLHRLETGVHAIVVDARRTRRTDAAHDDIADFDRLTAGNRNDIRQRHLLVGN